MPKRIFRTIPEELLELAEVAAQHFDSLGYTVRVEKTDLGFPSTPALLCSRQRTRVVVEIDSSLQATRIEQWAAYGRSAGHDFRVVLCLPNELHLSAEDDEYLRRLGVGCMILNVTHLTEKISPADLALNVTLPEIATLPKRLRELLGPAYEQFGMAQWREGFETACQAFEAEARRYLKRHRSRILLSGKQGKETIRPAVVDRMTMGQLAGTYARILNQNLNDSTIGKTLSAVNRDRIGVAHHKSKKTTERRLRANVGRHMWSLVSGLRLAIQ